MNNMDFLSTVAAIGIGYMLGRFCYDFLRSSMKPDPMQDFFTELAKAKKDQDFIERTAKNTGMSEFEVMEALKDR